MKVSIIIADDFAVVRRGLRALLEMDPDWQVIGEAGSGHDAVSQVLRLRPDIAILDVGMPGLNGLDAARLILKSLPEVQVLVLTAYHSDEMLEKALQAGVRAYVLKADVEADLVAAVKALTQGRTFFSSAASELLVGRLRGGKQNTMQTGLTPREAEIVQLLSEGQSNKEVGTTLGISTRTVENHRAQIMQKLGVRTFSDLIRYAIRNGIIEP